jgi:hypothetical protein
VTLSVAGARLRDRDVDDIIIKVIRKVYPQVMAQPGACSSPMCADWPDRGGIL